MAAGCGQDGEPTASTTTAVDTTRDDAPDTIVDGDPDVTAASTVPGNSDKFPGSDPGVTTEDVTPGGTFEQPDPGSRPPGSP